MLGSLEASRVWVVSLTMSHAASRAMPADEGTGFLAARAEALTSVCWSEPTRRVGC